MPTEDAILYVIAKDGYSMGETAVLHYRGDHWEVWPIMDASKDGQRWVGRGPTRLDAAVELFEQLNGE